jgi:hypothetical protein
MFERTDFFDNEGNFKIPVDFDFEYFSDYDNEDIYNIPNGFMEFYYQNPPPDRNLLRKLKQDIEEQIPVLLDIGFKTDYDTDQNGRIIPLHNNINDEQTIKLIKSIISNIFWSQNIIEKIESQLRKTRNAM